MQNIKRIKFLLENLPSSFSKNILENLDSFSEKELQEIQFLLEAKNPEEIRKILELKTREIMEYLNKYKMLKKTYSKKVLKKKEEYSERQETKILDNLLNSIS